MAPLLHYIESLLGKLFSSVKEHDARLFSRNVPALAERERTIVITSSELGEASPGRFTADKHELLGQNIFPALSWEASEPTVESVKSWLLVVEDPDAPLPSPPVHGIFYDIPRDKTTLSAQDFVESKDGVPGSLQGGFKFGQNRRGTIWIGPRPIIDHGDHRYFFTVVGLNSASLQNEGHTENVTRELLTAADGPLKGKILCWGEYIASFERKL